MRTHGRRQRQAAPFPGIAAAPQELVQRTLGGAGAVEHVRAGFMRKAGMTLDFKDLDFPSFVLVYVLQGRGRYIDRHGVSHALQAGSCFQRIPGCLHSNYIEPGSDWVEFFLDIGPGIWRMLRAVRFAIAEPVCAEIGLDSNLAEACWALKEQLKHAEHDELSDVLLTALELLNTFMKRIRGQGGDEAAHMIERGCAYLDTHPATRLRLPDFCRKHGWGYEHFRKVFTERMGITPHQYRIRRRLDAACQMLLAPGMTVARVADAIGYSSPYEFSAQFRKHIGIPPSRFRSGS